ncbi:Microtubule-associated proteins 1A/1B light chain 3B [Geodia barretti]|uniref:Microtubule-associated proteins 1A/1B light chain 3B n=1 Tax=Geodia barretti TaxID=519541 RepID=A0AA35SAQ1_GEOBA|nr:Microtubule-associated proteins 1A/1B light chain 3B [Geodia barretti]
MENAFKKRKCFADRKRDVDEIAKRHPNKVPLIVERGRREKHLPLLDKSKFLVPEELNMMPTHGHHPVRSPSFLVHNLPPSIFLQRLQLTDSQAFYLLINGRTMAGASMMLRDVYSSDKDDDGFLYCTYTSQEAFG